MKSPETKVTEPIVVLSAKPEPALPEVSTPYVLGANGAIEVGLPYREKYKSKLICLVPGLELRKHEHIRASIIKAKPDEMILFGDDGVDIVSYIKNEMRLPDTKITLYKAVNERHQFMKKVLGWRIVPVMIERVKARGLRHLFRKMIPDMIFGGDKDWLSHSTGLDAIMYAMERFPNTKEIITAGIGLQGGEHFNKEGVFMAKTAIADRGTMAHWPLSLRPQVYTTDDAMHTIGGVPKWGGPTFRV